MQQNFKMGLLHPVADKHNTHYKNHRNTTNTIKQYIYIYIISIACKHR
jgi:hypothetical protein